MSGKPKKREGLPLELLQTWLSLVYQDRPKALAHYFDDVLPKVLELVESDAQHETLRQSECHTLISLMGLSNYLCAAS